MCVSYILIMSSPAVSVPNLSAWLQNSKIVAVPTDRSVINPNHFYRDAPAMPHGQLFAHHQRAAWAGDAQAQYQLGLAYEYGLGVPANAMVALQWYEASANQSFADAQMRLGYAHQDGALGLVSNDFKASQWFNKASAPVQHSVRLMQMH